MQDEDFDDDSEIDPDELADARLAALPMGSITYVHDWQVAAYVSCKASLSNAGSISLFIDHRKEQFQRTRQSDSPTMEPLAMQLSRGEYEECMAPVAAAFLCLCVAHTSIQILFFSLQTSGIR